MNSFDVANYETQYIWDGFQDQVEDYEWMLTSECTNDIMSTSDTLSPDLDQFFSTELDKYPVYVLVTSLI